MYATINMKQDQGQGVLVLQTVVMLLSLRGLQGLLQCS